MRIYARDLVGMAAGSPVRLAGRLLARDAAGGSLRDESGSARIEGSGLPAELALVAIAGVWDGAAVQLTAVELLQAPAGPGDLRGSEWWALARDGERKLRNLRARARILRLVREYFDGEGFLEVETPIAVPSPGLDLHLDAMAVACKQGERYLITSPEYQMKRLLSGGLERIFQLTKCFRNDEIGERHQPEFTLLEWYRAFCGMDSMLKDTEELVARVARGVAGGDPAGAVPALLHTAAGPIDVTPPWTRISVREAFGRYAGVALDDVVADEDRFYRLLVERVEPGLTELGAVFLCEYPASMASLARKKPSDPSVAERFEAYVGGIELCNGFGELTDPIEQRARLERDRAERQARRLPVYPIDERFLAALEQGMPPSGGNALGVDRLVMLALGASHIEDVVAIPASRL